MATRHTSMEVIGDITGVTTVETTNLTVENISTIVHRAKASDQSVADNILADDDDLHFSVKNGEVWHIRLWLRVSAHADTDWKYKLVAPSGSAGSFVALLYEAPSSSPTPVTPDIETTDVNSGSHLETLGGADLVIIEGTITMGNDGTFKLTWAKNVTPGGGGDAVVFTGSFLHACRTP